MKKKFMSILATVFTLSILVGVNAMASDRTETIYLQKNQVWNVRASVTRSGQYSEVSARCYSVYPISGTDNFKKIQVIARDTLGKNITKLYTLNERDSEVTFVKINEGSLNVSNVVFAFRGNDADHPANAHVYYNGR